MGPHRCGEDAATVERRRGNEVEDGKHDVGEREPAERGDHDRWHGKCSASQREPRKDPGEADADRWTGNGDLCERASRRHLTVEA